MKTPSLLIVFTIIGTISFGQTVFRKRYYFPDQITIQSKLDSPSRKNNERKSGKADKFKPYVINLSFWNSIDSIDVIAQLNSEFNQYAKKNTPSRLKANVKFVGNQLFINPWTMGDDEVRDQDYYFRLKNRQQVKLHYQQLTFTALTIPLKVQFGRDNSVNYQTGISIGSLLGYSWGNTRFTYRSKLDNFQRSQEFTIGGLVNVSSIKFNNSNNREVNTGSIALGLGALYTYETISVGVTYGFEWAVGQYSLDWNYNDRPWLGFAIGYSLFKK